MLAQIIDRTGGHVAIGVVLGLHLAGQQRGVQTVRGVDFQAQTGVDGAAAVAVLIGVVLGRGRAAQALGLRVKTIAGLARDAQRIVNAATGAAETGIDLAGVVRAQAHFDERRKTALTALGKELDHPAQRIRAIDGGGRAAQHFNAVNQRQRNGLPRSAAGGLRIDPHAVDIDRREARFGAPQVHAGGSAGAAIAGNFNAGNALEHIGHRHGAAALDLLTVNDAHIGNHIAQGLGAARGRDDGLFELRRSLRLRQRRKCSGQSQGHKRQAQVGNTGIHESNHQQTALTSFPASA